MAGKFGGFEPLVGRARRVKKVQPAVQDARRRAGHGVGGRGVREEIQAGGPASTPAVKGAPAAEPTTTPGVGVGRAAGRGTWALQKIIQQAWGEGWQALAGAARRHARRPRRSGQARLPARARGRPKSPAGRRARPRRRRWRGAGSLLGCGVGAAGRPRPCIKGPAHVRRVALTADDKIAARPAAGAAAVAGQGGRQCCLRPCGGSATQCSWGPWGSAQRPPVRTCVDAGAKHRRRRAKARAAARTAVGRAFEQRRGRRRRRAPRREADLGRAARRARARGGAPRAGRRARAPAGVEGSGARPASRGRLDAVDRQ
jgi:hypothetical protein